MSRLKQLLYGYLWGKRDKIKRSTISKKLSEGGLNMIDIDCYIDSLKATWVPRFLNASGKWIDVLHHYMHRTGLSLEYVLKTNVRSVKELPILQLLPSFYREIILAFNKCKVVKQFKSLNKHEIIAQPIWDNSYFRVGNECLYFKEWIKSGLLYVQDLITLDGVSGNEMYFFNKVKDKKNIIKQLYVIKNIVLKKIKIHDLSIAPYVKIRKITHIIVRNKLLNLSTSKSKDFYDILVSKCQSDGSMQSIYMRNLILKKKRKKKEWGMENGKCLLALPFECFI